MMIYVLAAGFNSTEMSGPSPFMSLCVCNLLLRMRKTIEIPICLKNDATSSTLVLDIPDC